MNAELDPTLLAELREIHFSERAPAELERSVIERLLPSRDNLPSRDEEPLGARLRAWWRRAPFGWTVLGATSSMAAVGALYLGSRLLSVEASRVLGPEPRPEAAHAARKTPHCPLEQLPPGFTYEPTRMGAEAIRAGLQLDTFAMRVPGCPPLVRRMLVYAPRRMALRGPLPVLIVLHDGGDSAEGVRALQAQGSFDAQAEVDGFLVVYANAAPTGGRFPNSGFWQTDPGANRAIDDVAYLARVVERLGERWPAPVRPEQVESREGPAKVVYLVGYGSGAQLALEAAAQHPDRYAGVAAILPDKVNHSRPPPHSADTRLSRLLFVTLQEEHPGGHWPGAPLDVGVLNDWKAAVGLPHLTIQPQTNGDQLVKGERPLQAVAVADTALLPRRVVPTGTRLFTASFPDHRGVAVCALVVQSKAAIDVGPGGSPAPMDAAKIVRAFFFEGDVPGQPGAAAP
jgi:pimeloyl-ACP methyl ester carboxylesterase